MNNKIELTPYHMIFYFEWKLNPTRTDYHMVLDQLLEGDLNVERLNRSLKRFISDYYLMNSHIEVNNGKYFWVENNSIQELEYFANGCDSIELKKFIGKDFNLENGCLYRYRLIKIEEKKFRFIFIGQHILIDGSSTEYFYNEISKYYNDENYFCGMNIREQKNNLHNLSLYLNNTIKNNHEKFNNFWNNSLQNIEPIDLKFLKYSEISKDKINYKHESIQNLFKISENNFTFDHILIKKIKSISSKYEITPYSFSNIILAITLFKFTKNENFCISYPIAIKEGIDFFYGGNVNTCLLPFHLNGNLNIVDIIHQIKEFIKSLKVDNIKQSYFPIYELEIKDKGEILNLSFASTNLQNITLSFENIKAHVSQNSFIALANDISFGYEELNGLLNFRVNYRCNKISSELMNNFCKIYEYIYSQIVNNLIETEKGEKLKNINDYYLIPHEDYYKYLDIVNSKTIENLDKRTVSQCFEEQALLTPQNIAIVSTKNRLTYSELNQRANQLAHYIKDKYAIKADDLVALCLERDEHMLISILAVLKAGGAYVPIDPEYPVERMEYILEDTGAKVILTNESHKELFSTVRLQNVNIELIDAKNFEYTLQKQKECNLKSQINNHNLAYVIYTSGTTGKPKGVLIEHCNVIRLFSCTDKLFHFNSQDVWTLFHSYAFDFSVWEIWGALLYGGKLVIPSKQCTKDFEIFYQLCINENVTVLNQTPSAFYQFSEIVHQNKVNDNIRFVIFGGEALNSLQLKTWWDCKGLQAKLINMYGITETTVHVTYKELIPNESLKSDIGKPISDLTTYVLDANLNLMPIGSVGELYVGGLGLSRGYLNKENLTAERFILNPFQTEQQKISNFNSRLYKSGDLVRLLPNGNLEYIGRNDFQVKIRGFRIELGDIENAVLCFDGIKQTAVIVKNIGSDDSNKALICYYIAEFLIDSKVLIQYLSEKIPDYMIPSFFMQLSAIPLTINGKLDKKALPEINIKNIVEFEAPRNEIEKNIASIWEEVLSLDKGSVGIRNDFFSLGGNSITAIKLLNHMNKKLELNISLKDFLNTNNIERLVKELQIIDKNSIEISKYEFKNAEEQILSFAQERLWFIDKLENEVNSYNIPMLYKLSANVNEESLLLSLREIITRHEVLRSVIKESAEGKAYQEALFDNGNSFQLSIIECDSKNIFEEKLKENMNYTFNLNREIPLRACIYIVKNDNGTRNKYLNITIHHIAFDGWSTEVFLSELLSFYEYFEKNEQTKKILPLEIQYKDFAKWQKNYLQGQVLDQEMKYWKSKLSGIEALDLHLDKQRPLQIDYKGQNVFFELDEHLSNDLRIISKNLDLSMYSLLLSSYYLMLSCISGQKDIVVGSPIANRHYPKIAETIGYFVNTIVLRAQIDPDVSLVEFIKAVGKEVVEAQQHQDLPFEKLVVEISPERDQSKHPIFQVMFGMDTFQAKQFSYIFENSTEFDLNLNQMYSPAKFDLSLFMDEGQKKILGCFNYAESLFHEETIKNYVSIFLQLLKEFVLLKNNYSSSEFKIKQLNYLPVDQMNYIYNQNFTIHENYYKNIVQCFEEQVLLTPHNIALVSTKNKLTYSELNQRANQLAHYLKEKYEIKADDLVALCLERDEHMLISILAVLKTGGAYVPMDPEYPVERIEYILEDIGANVLLTNESNKELFNNENLRKLNIELIDENNLEYTLQKQKQCNLTLQIENHHLAYVIYTSGTTGKPKGVLIEHAGVMNLIVNQGNFIAKEFKENKYISVLWFANYVFDANILELSTSIFHGHCLNIVTNEVRKDLQLLSEYVKEYKINYAVLPPSLLNKDNVLEIDFITVAGDKFNKNILENYLNHQKKVMNAYGPTETTVMSNTHKYHYPEEVNWIGNALPNYTNYVLDSHLKLLPIGAIGELYIGGIGVARGYLNKPELTAEKFIANPYQTEQEKLSCFNSRLYKSGDLVRLLPNGSLEYIGRNDSQVKIRGFRIELGEIESTILGFKNIKQAAAIVKTIGDASSEHKFLICYYVADEEMNEKELKEYLSSCLPEFMLPHYYVYLKELPLTVNGKLDKRALPNPIITQVKDFVAPRNELEKNICEIWESVLGLPKDSVGIKSDFFSLGGDSIVSIQIVGRMRSQLGVVVNVKDIFKYKCIELLSEHIKNNSNDKTIEIKREEGILSGIVPLLAIQEWFFSHEFKVPGHWNQSFLIKTPLLNFEILKNSIHKLIEHHDAFRLGYTYENKTWKQSYHTDISLPEIKYLNIESLIEKEGTEIFNQKLSEIFTSWQCHFNLETGTLFSFGYVEGFQDKTARIFISMHHLITDAVSWRIIIEDLQSLYGQKKLSKKGTSYRQWVEGLNKYSASICHEKDYWETNLIQAKEFNLSLKSAYHKKLLKNDSLNIAEFRLPENLTQKLLTVCNKAYKTEINDILLAAFIASIKEQTGLEHQTILLEGHGREEIDSSFDLTKTVGWFTSMYPVCFKANNDLEKLIVGVKECLREVPNKGIGYSSLYSYVVNELPCLSFNYLGQFESESNKAYSSDNWQIVSENSGVPMSPNNRMKHTIGANGMIMNGSLSFVIDTKLDKETTDQLAFYFKDYLSKIVIRLSDLNRSYLTSSDIGHIINQSYLDILQKEKEIETIYLANSLQQGFVYHALNQGDIDDAYFVQIVWKYKNPLKQERLKDAWNIAVSKYEVLRLRFAWDEELVQIIDKNGMIDWQYFDLSDIQDPFNQKKYIKDFQKKDREIKFQLDMGNLARVTLFKHSEEEYTCVFSNHHAILDGWSLPVLLNDIHKIYLNLIDNNVIEMEHNFSYGEAQLYFNKHKDENISFWNNYVADIENDLDLNGLLSQKAKENALSFNGYKHVKDPQQKEFVCEEKLYYELKKICQSHSVTINAMLQYVWHKVLSVYGNSLKTCVGTTVSGRNIPVDNIENSVGLFINTLPLKVNHNSNPERKVVDCVKEIQDQINEINSRSVVNLSTLQKNGERLFDCIFVFENYPSVNSDNLTQRLRTEMQMDDIFEALDYPFTTIAYDAGNHLYCKLKFPGELFETHAIEKLLGLMKQLLLQISSDQNILVHSLKYLNENEFGKILGEWNPTNETRLKQKNIVQCFEEQVLKTPHNIALVSENNRLTYSELNQRANQLAHYIKDKYAIKADDLVALCLERNEHMLTSIFAVLKAGGAYVPVDPEFPIERIAYILGDTGAKVLLTNESHKELFNTVNLNKIKIELIDEKNLEYTLQKQKQSNLTSQINNHHLAYVIYTSGTTGKPKGVLMGHESCTNRISYMIKENEMKSEDIFLFKTNLVFDVSFSDIFTTLLSGAKLIISKKSFDIDEIERLILNQNITICHFVPSQFKLFLDEVKIDNLKSLNKIMFSGEEFDPRLVKKEIRSGRIFLNYYGPTETGEVTVKKYNSDFNFDLKNSSIGKVFDNSKIFVLDKNLIPLPIGSVGELYIGGVSVAHGYLNKLELTAERFLANPLQTEKEEKLNINGHLYKTGDLVRWLENGELEYIGRNDFQIKIRGFRIELGEIENAVLCFDGIKHAVTVIKNIGNDDSNKVLICYYTAEMLIDNKALAIYLSEKIPNYMIPSFFIQLGAIPLTINGKLDKKALPEVNIKSIVEFEAPRNEFERKISAIWEEVLSLEKGSVGIKSDFFSLGGNSITAIKLLNHMNKKLELNVSLKDFLAAKNIENIVLGLIVKKENSIELEKYKFKNPEEQILSFAQERLWFIDKLENGVNSYNIPMLFKLSAKVNEESLLLSLQAIITRHEVLRSVIKESKDGIAYQEALFDNGNTFQLSIIECDTRIIFEEKLKENMNYTFNLNREIPLCGYIYILKNDNETREKYLNITIHHIAFDGWSTELFLSELLRFYEYFEKNDQTKKISPLVLQYKDFAKWQKNYLQGQVLEQEMKYWKDKLSGIEALDLHLDKQRPLQIDYKGQNVFFELDEHLSNDLRIISKNLDLSMYSLFLSSYYLMLSCISGQKDIVIGSPIANRHYPKIEEIIGYFVNTIVLRAQINPDVNLIEFIKSVGKEVVEAQQHQDLPFEKLVVEISPERDQSKHPIFQVMFGMNTFQENQNDEKFLNLFEKPSEGDEILNQMYSPAKFDLSLFLNEGQKKISGCFNYAESLFHAETIKNYVSVYLQVLKEFALLKNNYSGSDFKLKQLNYLPKDQLNHIFAQKLSVNESYYKDKNIVQCFEEQVSLTPHNIALVSAKNKLTYSELNQRANQLAHYIKDKYAIKADDLVALCLERDEHMLISILAVLKAGGAYVPMDPEYPMERIKYILGDTDAKLLLTNDCHKNLFKTNNSRKISIEFIDEKNFEYTLQKQKECNLTSQINNHHLAYVIYTSGTTGKPKGVLIEHAGVINLIENQGNFIAKEFKENKYISVLWFANYVFDANILELSTSIFHGHCLNIVTNDIRRDLQLLSEYVKEHKINYAVLPPSLLDKDNVLEIDFLTVAGDKFNKNILGNYLNHQKKVMNAYGPTETTVISNTHKYNHPDEVNCIGNSLSNYTNYVLDSHLKLLPIGAIGELYIGGIGVARGYLNKPELTAEKFIANPYQTEQEKLSCFNSRLYKSGDLVRLLPNGSLEYIGRNDSQVKIRGFRIELGEIESAILGYKNIKQAAAVVKTLGDGSSEHKFLICYYVANEEMNEKELKEYLSSCLPEFMLPHYYVYLKDLPLTVNGKLDKRALPNPIITQAKDLVAPRNELEKNICEIWESVLGLPQNSIGINNKFFSIGGDSISSIKIVNIMKKNLGIFLNIKDIFTYNSVEKLSNFIKERSSDIKSIKNDVDEFKNPDSIMETEYKQIIELNKSYDKPIIFMIHSGRGGCDVYNDLSFKMKDHFHCYGVEHYNLYHEKMIVDFYELCENYLEHIQKLMNTTNQKTYHLLGWSLGGNIALEIASILEKRGISNINIYLLDSVYDNLQVLNLSIEKNEMDYLIKNELSPREVTNIKKIIETMDIESKFIKQDISSKLKHTKTLLFKAMVDYKLTGNINVDQYFKNQIDLKDNNIPSTLLNPEQFQMIKAQNASHLSIIEEEELILSEILKFIS